jgi:L-threonylcarbamoyladenylate synthase
LIGRVFGGAHTPAAPKSPGQQLSHYAPSLPVRLEAVVAERDEAFLGFGPGPGTTLNLSAAGDLREAAANLFAMLRRLDDKRFTGIAVAAIPETGLGIAINDRLRRAAWKV